MFLCPYVYLRNPSDKLSKSFLIITLVSTYTGTCELFSLISPDAEGAAFWHKASFLWPFLPFMFYQFIIVQTESKKFSSKIINILIFLPGLCLSGIHLFTNLLYKDLVHHSYGWQYNDVTNIYLTLITIYFILYGIITIIIGLTYFLKQNNEIKRKQSLYTITGLSIPLVAGMVIKGILPTLFGFNPPPMTPLFYLMGSIFLSTGILKYKAFLVNPFDVIKNMFDASPDYFVIYDSNRKIILVSKSFLRRTLYSEEEIIGKTIDIFFNDKNYPVEMELTEGIGKEIELDLITKNKDQIHVSVTKSVINNYLINGNYYLILGRDLSERKNFENQLIQFKLELEEKVRNRTAELAKSNLDLSLEIKEKKKC